MFVEVALAVLVVLLGLALIGGIGLVFYVKAKTRKAARARIQNVDDTSSHMEEVGEDSNLTRVLQRQANAEIIFRGKKRDVCFVTADLGTNAQIRATMITAAAQLAEAKSQGAPMSEDAIQTALYDLSARATLFFTTRRIGQPGKRFFAGLDEVVNMTDAELVNALKARGKVLKLMRTGENGEEGAVDDQTLGK